MPGTAALYTDRHTGRAFGHLSGTSASTALDFYNEMGCVIIERAAAIMGLCIDKEGAREIARRARGTPRIALPLRRVWTLPW